MQGKLKATQCTWYHILKSVVWLVILINAVSRLFPIIKTPYLVHAEIYFWMGFEPATSSQHFLNTRSLRPRSDHSQVEYETNFRRNVLLSGRIVDSLRWPKHLCFCTIECILLFLWGYPSIARIALVDRCARLADLTFALPYRASFLSFEYFSLCLVYIWIGFSLVWVVC